ncbi:MAG TPA: HD domain-containing phosphohydrolase [Thermodesulfobacteriota bacterium]|nr:HD domain-containing phosphohydrolase [Thermodesulfobacteriota bacterium]
MEPLKQFIVKHFEKVLITIILMAAFIGTILIEEKSIVLNFYYLPVLSAGYFLGRRMGVLTAILSILVVVVSTLFFPTLFFKGEEFFNVLAQFFSWGGFLILASIAVGTLYEQNEKRLQDLKNAYIGVLEILSKYLESTDHYTRGHSVRVSELAMQIAIAMELPRGEVENIRVAGLLHDIGKIEVSGEILRKAAELSSEERELINEHTVKGAYLLSSVGSVLKEVVPIVVSHHKYFMSGLENKGNGANNIPLGARVIAVADAFDAMTTDRPYRKGIPPWEALEEIVKKAGQQFDPEVIEPFKRVLSDKMERVY